MKFKRHRQLASNIRLYKPADFAKMRKAGFVVASILDELAELVVPGVTTGEIDEHNMELIKKFGARSATIGYRGYKHSSCISVNHVVCHGIPGRKRLKNGDILNIDVTVIVDGWYGDSSRMYVVGQPSRRCERLIRVTHDALMLAIKEIRPGATFGDIGAVIQSHAKSHRMSVVREFCGHGIGREFHLPPNVVHVGQRGKGAMIQEGMFFTIEPMINLGTPETKILADSWTAVTRDRSPSAQFEHTIGVTSDGCEIFTQSPNNRFFPANW